MNWAKPDWNVADLNVARLEVKYDTSKRNHEATTKRIFTIILSLDLKRFCIVDLSCRMFHEFYRDVVFTEMRAVEFLRENDLLSRVTHEVRWDWEYCEGLLWRTSTIPGYHFFTLLFSLNFFHNFYILRHYVTDARLWWSTLRGRVCTMISAFVQCKHRALLVRRKDSPFSRSGGEQRQKNDEACWRLSPEKKLQVVLQPYP